VHVHVHVCVSAWCVFDYMEGMCVCLCVCVGGGVCMCVGYQFNRCGSWSRAADIPRHRPQAPVRERTGSVYVRSCGER